MKRSILTLSSAMALCVAGLSVSGCTQNKESASVTSAPAQMVTVDLKNTVCPVSGESVGTSKLVETYDGKTYHFCCDDCPVEFKKDPGKYAKAVAADPAKYGVAPATRGS